MKKDIKKKELKITVNTLEVNGKGITHAFFKQIPIKQVYTNDYALINGVNLWGIVNYKISGHLNEKWVVFELDDILYKGDIDQPNAIPDIIQQEAEVEFRKDALESMKQDPKISGEEIEEQIGSISLAEIALKLYKDGYKSVETVKSLPQLFIAI